MGRIYDIMGSQQSPDVSNTSQVSSTSDPDSRMLTVGCQEEEELRYFFTKSQILLDELEREPRAFLPGQPELGLSKQRSYLAEFYLPRSVSTAIKAKSIDELGLARPLTPKNYVERFQTLLWVEEAHQSSEMRKYNLSGVTLRRLYRKFYLLAMPGLAEGRPSLFVGDKLKLKSGLFHCNGKIREVRMDDILIDINAGRHSYRLGGLKFDVSFMLSRTPFRRCHNAVTNYINRHLKTLFPRPELDQCPEPLIDFIEFDTESFRYFRENLNIHQRNAVINVLEAKCRPAPYIIFGPPGTGKTVTMIEAVHQVYARSPNGKILVCANSNTCVDNLATRIKDAGVIPLDKIVRIAASYRMDKLIPPEIMDITREMSMISPQGYRRFRIIITTCSQSGALNIFSDKFDYVFFDEAGLASEPEALISINLLKEGGCIVLAGDPHQLGPVCMSQMSADHGLGTSLLERLYKLPVYQRQMINSNLTHDDRYLTKLIICYRSDPRVMVVNNELFYDNELEFHAETPNELLSYLEIENPLVFHEVQGEDLREPMNPSWFNPQEAKQCVDYVRRLYKFGLKPHQLGIITPYRLQITKLNTLLENFRLAKCKIGTMEAFQGDEREVIIISTVRTRPENIEFDQEFDLGFLFNPKRFNVALSRAKWLVLVVGDSNILSRDDCWAKYFGAAQRLEA